ncbi:Glycosyltransferase involved in cell wall bisynthesis [Algibacter lectus]|uniref:glycosyltransferase family 2 protein n=1 Tax=Algibacter lectus TaxID=221126 RepID=UPI0008E4E122|nr:glycosyltransferase family 2 protein [Algibacter lectus]SFC35577.1 Glycosyltransferase involved in cell wall bisynthesis [Algibacter lectus]
MKTITVFTPAYNRAYCLNQCYESLVRQTEQDFCWLIIDDGSTDNTKTLVQSWIDANLIDIQYHYQENQGMHGAHNTAYSLINTELNVCIDSDDFMPDDAIEQIAKCWCKVKGNENIAGLIGLDSYKNSEIIGQKIPKEINETTLEDLHNKWHVTGDKKLVLRSEIVKRFQPYYPIFPDERFVPLGTLYLLIDKQYKLKPLNKVLCIVEYMEDGSSRNILKQYRRHPKGFQYARILTIEHSKYLKVKFKNAIHLIAHSIQLKDWKVFYKTPNLILTLLAIPFGIILYTHVYYVNNLKK